MIRAGVVLVAAGVVVLVRAPKVLIGADVAVWWAGAGAVVVGGLVLLAAGGWRFADWVADRLEAMSGSRQ